MKKFYRVLDRLQTDRPEVGKENKAEKGGAELGKAAITNSSSSSSKLEGAGKSSAAKLACGKGGPHSSGVGCAANPIVVDPQCPKKPYVAPQCPKKPYVAPKRPPLTDEQRVRAAENRKRALERAKRRKLEENR